MKGTGFASIRGASPTSNAPAPPRRLPEPSPARALLLVSGARALLRVFEQDDSSRIDTRNCARFVGHDAIGEARCVGVLGELFGLPKLFAVAHDEQPERGRRDQPMPVRRTRSAEGG